MCTLEIKEKCSEIMDEVIRIRRDIHKNPELALMNTGHPPSHRIL